MRLREFRVGDVIPTGAKYVRCERREIPGSTYEEVIAPSTFLSWLGVTERVALMVKCETVYIYEMPDVAAEVEHGNEIRAKYEWRGG